jgi:Mn-containing catalase
MAAVIGGMDPQQAIVGGGGAMPQDSQGVPWNGRYIVASGNLLADFRTNVAAEAQGRLQTARLYNMTDDPGVKQMLKFNLARDTYHQNMWLAAIEELKADGIEDTVAPDALLDEEHAEHATSLWNLSEGEESAQGRWAHGTAPDGRHEMGMVAAPQPLGGPAAAPAPDPLLYASYDGSKGAPRDPGLTGAKGVVGKLREGLS